MSRIATLLAVLSIFLTLGLTDARAQSPDDFFDAMRDFFDPSDDRDYHRHDNHDYHGHDYKDEYIIRHGRLWEWNRGRYRALRDPIGVRMRKLPWGCERVRIRGHYYYTRQGIYLEETRRGYIVVREPRRHGHGRW